MKWFANMKVSKKLALGFSLVMLIAVAVGAVGIASLDTVVRNGTQMYEHMTVPIAQLAEVASSFQRICLNLRSAILMNSPTYLTQWQEEMAQSRQVIDEQAEAFSRLILLEEEQQAYDAFVEARRVFTGYEDQIMAMAWEKRNVDAFALLRSDEFKQAEQAEEAAIFKLVELKRAAAEETARESDRLFRSATTGMLITIAASVALSIVIALLIARLISKSLKKVTAAAERIADGDLAAEVDIDSKDEVGDLARSFHRMTGNLNEVLSGIRAASEQVSAGADQLSDSSMSLSQGASEQASSIEELTSSLEQISAQTKQNAQNANEANKLASTARGDAERGNEEMQEMLRAMEEINESSNNISRIIKVIDDIAFQTNILALNAAVEAARAGEHGKGFAVVAEEVRNLAAKSASAAKETTDMIGGSIAKVDAGTRLAVHTAEALKKIVDGVSDAASLVSRIDAASNEQAIGLAQINQAVTQVSQIVQANSAASEQSAAASKELASQAEMMRNAVGKFHLKREGNARSYARGSDAQQDAEPAAYPRGVKEHLQTTAARPTIALSDEDFGKY